MRVHSFIILCWLLALPGLADAARLFTNGLEENNVIAGAAGAAIWTSTLGTAPTVGSTAPHSGTYRLDAAANVATNAIRWQNSGSSVTSGTWFVRTYWRTTDVTPEADCAIIRMNSSGVVDRVQIKLLTTGVLRLSNTTGGTTADMTYALVADTWYRIELRDLISGTVGELELRLYADASNTLLDSVSLTAQNTGSLGQVDFGKIAASAISGTHSVDDIAVNDATGTFATSWPGQGKIALIKPDADTTVAWTKGGSAPAGTNFGGVAEVPGTVDDATTYNFDGGSSNEDKLGLSDLPAEVTSDATLILLDAYAKVSASASSGTMALKVWDEGGTGTQGPTMTVSTTSWRILNGAEHQSYDLSAKTKANVNSFSAGYKALSGAVEKRVSSLWVNVEWIETASVQTPFFQRRLQQ